MKKTRFLALASLCSVLAGMPANAGKIKDSGTKKIGGVGTQVDKEDEFIKRAQTILNFVCVYGLHEIFSYLTYFGPVPDGLYEKIAWASIAGLYHKHKMKACRAYQNVESFEIMGRPQYYIDLFYRVINEIRCWSAHGEFDKYIEELIDLDKLNQYKNNSKDGVSKLEKIEDERINRYLTNERAKKKYGENADKGFERFVEYFNFYSCYYKQGSKYGAAVIYCLKEKEKDCFSKFYSLTKDGNFFNLLHRTSFLVLYSKDDDYLPPWKNK